MNLMRLALTILFLCCAISCQQKDQIVVSKILVDRDEGADLVFPDRGELKDWIKETLDSHPNFKFREEATDGSILRVRFGAMSSGAKRIYVATVLLSEKEGVRRQLQAESVLEFTPQKLRQAFNQGFKRDLDAMISDLQVTSNSTASSLQILKDYVNGTSMSEGEVAGAIRKVAQDRDEKATVFLVKLLKGRNIRLAVQSLQALSAIGAADAVDAITDFAERKSPELRRHAIEAVRRIGGPKAASWLFTLSTGHSDEQVRESARLALIDVERRLNASSSRSGGNVKEFLTKN